MLVNVEKQSRFYLHVEPLEYIKTTQQRTPFPPVRTH